MLFRFTAVPILLACAVGLMSACSSEVEKNQRTAFALDGAAALSVRADLKLSSSTVGPGATLTGTVTYENLTDAAVTVLSGAIAGRPPGASHGGGPYEDLTPYAAETTVAPGATITLTGSRTFATGDASGSWTFYPTYQDASGWHDGPEQRIDVTSAPAAPRAAGGRFSIADGKIIGPDGSSFVARGLNVYDAQQGTVSTNAAGQPLTDVFPGVNFVRLATYEYADPSYFRTFVEQMSALRIVVEIEHHSGAGGGVTPLTGQALQDESNWFASLGSAFKDNPYVWFGTLNEPGGPGADLTAEQVSNYNAIRDAGNDNIIMMEILGDYSTGSLVIGRDHGLLADSYASLRNIVWDFHYYNWLSGYSADVGTNANLLARYIDQAQTITSADGKVPVLIGEYGVSTDGQNEDGGGTASCIAVQQSGYGSAAWHWASGAPSDNLTDGNNNLTSYGAQVATYINAGRP